MWIKICGVHDITAAREIAQLEPDAIGLNFFEKSVRSVDVACAVEIAGSLPEHIEPIGLFVNHSPAAIAATCHECGLKKIQLHGDEPPELLAELRDRLGDVEIIRAFRIGPAGTQPVGDYLAACEELNAKPAACLIDARVEGLYGGSGETVCWSSLAKEYQRNSWPPLILAGGLIPANVAEAVEIVRPWGVDVASGVESKPGETDIDLVRAFIETAREAFRTVDGS